MSLSQITISAAFSKVYRNHTRILLPLGLHCTALPRSYSELARYALYDNMLSVYFALQCFPRAVHGALLQVVVLQLGKTMVIFGEAQCVALLAIALKCLFWKQ